MDDMRFTHKTRPILRWLNSWSPSPSPPRSPSASPDSSTPPSPSLASLNEALHEPLVIKRPPPAHLRRQPPLFGNLTRSTLPTASLCSQTCPSLVVSTPSVSPPSSLDTLRSLSALQPRSLSTSPVASSWWPSSFDPVSPPPPPPLRRKYRSPKNPIVFCHGLLGFDSVTIGPAIAPLQVTHWRGITEALEANGTEVLITRVPATSSPADRAKVLEQRISEVYSGRSVHLIGHSMGGLDCRYLTTHLTQRKFSVLSITTIASPHRGSSFADHFLSTVGPDRLPSVLSLLDLLPNGGGDGKAFEALTIESMHKFNEETPDVDGVRYFSWGAVYEPGIFDTWKWPHSVILEKEGPNDGLVSLKSSKWGTYLGTLSGVNHLDLVGWINTARYKWAEMMGREIKFRPATFYLGIADMLAGEVEGIPKEGEGGPPVRHKDQEVRQALSEAIEETEEDGAKIPTDEHQGAPTEESDGKIDPTTQLQEPHRT